MSACPVMASAVSASSRDWPRYDRFLKAIPAIRHPQPRLKDTGRYPRPAKQGQECLDVLSVRRGAAGRILCPPPGISKRVTAVGWNQVSFWVTLHSKGGLRNEYLAIASTCGRADC